MAEKLLSLSNSVCGELMVIGESRLHCVEEVSILEKTLRVYDMFGNIKGRM